MTDENAELRAEIDRLKQARRPFNDAFAERVIDAQVKEKERRPNE